MYKYYLIGNVYKDKYVVTNLINYANDKEMFSGKPKLCDIAIDPFDVKYNNYCCTDIKKYYSPMAYHDYNNISYAYPPYITIITPYKYNLNELDLDKYLKQLKANNDYYNSNYCSKYENIEHYKEKQKLYNQKIIVNHVWDRYDVFDTIETDREFRDNDIIKIDDKDYKVIYKFNKELSRHELYVDYDGIFEVDEKLKEKCELIIEELNLMIDKYNNEIDEMEVIIDDRFECYQASVESQEAKKSLICKIKNWFKGEKE